MHLVLAQALVMHKAADTRTEASAASYIQSNGILLKQHKQDYIWKRILTNTQYVY